MDNVSVLREFLFASPRLLILVLIAVQFCLAVRSARRRTRGAARNVWIGFGLSAILVALSHRVETDRESLREFCMKLALRIDEADAFGLTNNLANDFDVEGMDRDTFIFLLHNALGIDRIDDVRLSELRIQNVENDLTILEFNASALIRSPEIVLNRLTTRWRLTLRRGRSDWSVVGIMCIPVPPLHWRDLRDVLDAAAG